MERYICIHGHFYQPPRENAWLEQIEIQDAAYPFHDWNQRITAECYSPNAFSRVLDSEGRIVDIVNNYASISFNFGPTVLSWLEQHADSVYQSILYADRMSRDRFSGHGNALAQTYNHIIMPLANARDKRTQIDWGIRDFEHRFRRRPEGMWLPETAVDLETLDMLAACDIRFTILSPSQAARYRRLDDHHAWRDTRETGIDPTRTYEVHLPSGRRIAVFFYDGPISKAVAFEGLLNSGIHFAERLKSGFEDKRDWPQLLHIATDGETYGHHHRHGEMALAYALRYIEEQRIGRLTNYGEYLERHPPEYQVEIHEGTAWSCAHGVGRWERDCSCNSGLHPGYRQTWRGPLRSALDWLRDELASRYEAGAASYFDNPWAARDAYISVILDRSSENVDAFIRERIARPIGVDEQQTVLKLLELQRHALLMYTSCGWFFDEISGLETVQIIQYAARAMQLAGEIFDDDLEAAFLKRLEEAPSNDPAYGNGRVVYEKLVRPAMINLVQVGAHYAISDMFEDYVEEARIGCFNVRTEDKVSLSAGRTRFNTGRARISSAITRESQSVSFSVLHMGDHTLTGGVRTYRGPAEYDQMVQGGRDLFDAADLAELIRFLDRQFSASTYSLKSLFRDEQRRILNLMLESRLLEVEAELRRVYEHHAPLLRSLSNLRAPLPKAFLAAIEFVLNVDLRRTFEADELDLGEAERLMKEARRWPGIDLDRAGLAYTLQSTIRHFLDRLARQPESREHLTRLDEIVGMAQSTDFNVDFSDAQNHCFRMLQSLRPEMVRRAGAGEEAARQWLERFDQLCAKLSIRLP